MEPQVAQMIYDELQSIRERVQQIEQEIERVSIWLLHESKAPQSDDYMSIVGLGESGESAVSVDHDRYVGEAIASEHL